MNQSPDGGPDPAPLDYRTPEPSAAKDVAPAAIRGFIFGLGGILFYGVIIVSSQIPQVTVTTSPTTRAVVTSPAQWPVLLFLLPLAAAIFGVIATRGQRKRNAFYLGMLLGVGAVCLCVGICFITR